VRGRADPDYDPDAMLSRVLSEHTAGQLVRRGARTWTGVPIWDPKLRQFGEAEYPRGCALQVAWNEPEAGIYGPAQMLFDEYYDPGMTPEALLALLEGV
jgi:hypothetical protein